MSEAKMGSALQSVYNALIGGMLAVLGAVLVFSFLVNPNGPDYGSSTSIIAVFIGVGLCAAYLTAGMTLGDRLPWLNGAFLWASGFTAIWTGILSLSAEQRWAVAIAFAGVIALGIWLGWRKFGREEKTVAPIATGAPSNPEDSLR